MTTSTDVSRSTNNPQLRWKRLSDMRQASTCGRYVVDRLPHFENHPAVEYQYTAKRTDLQANPLGTFETFDLAAAACERDLSDQQQKRK